MEGHGGRREELSTDRHHSGSPGSGSGIAGDRRDLVLVLVDDFPDEAGRDHFRDYAVFAQEMNQVPHALGEWADVVVPEDCTARDGSAWRDWKSRCKPFEQLFEPFLVMRCEFFAFVQCVRGGEEAGISRCSFDSVMNDETDEACHGWTLP